MKGFKLFQIGLFFILSFLTLSAFAWNHSIEVGYGFSQDPNNTQYNNSGAMVSGDFYSLYRNTWSYWTLNAALGQWHSSAPFNRYLTTGALALALRLYPFTVLNNYPVYFLGSAGPAILSHREFGANSQGSNFSIQTLLGLGVEFNCLDVNLRLVHYSNANLSKPNEGFNILYMLSLGYLF